MNHYSFRKSLFAVMLLTLCGALNAEVTLQVNLGGNLTVPDGTVGVIVVDRSHNGFLSPNHVSALGTKLEVGQQIGLSDDIIVGVVQSSTSEFTGGSGFLGVEARIDYDKLQLAPGMPFAFYWFTGITSPGAPLGEATTVETFTTENASKVTSSITFTLPASRGVYDLVYLDSGNGGNVTINDPGNPGNDLENPDIDGTYVTGAPGSDLSALPIGGNSPVIPEGVVQNTPVLVDINWLDAARGNYQGLMVGAGGQVINGEISVSVSATGSVSVIIRTQDGTFRYKGGLNPDGDLINVAILRRDQSPASLSLELREDGATGSYSLVGSYTDDDGVSSIDATQTTYQRDRVHVAEAGRYTAVLPAPGAIDQNTLPAGDGIGIVAVGKTGKVRAAMSLGDGTKASESGILSDDGIWQVYVPLYRKKGFLAGRTAFRDVPNISDFDGALHWKKNPEAKPKWKSVYPLGFETSVNLVGASYVAPRRGATMLSQIIVGEENVQLDLQGGDLNPAFVPKLMTWDTNNKVSFAGVAGEFLKVSATKRNGIIRGSYVKKYVGGGGKRVTQTVRFKGVALQKQGVITGSFIGLNHTTGLLIIDSTGSPAIEVLDFSQDVLSNGGTLDFGSIGVDGGVGERLVEVRNTGTATLLLAGMPEVSDDSYGIVSAAAGYLKQGESSQIRVRFRPVAAGPYPATLTIMTNDPDANPFVLNLTAEGVPGADFDVDLGDNRNHSATPANQAMPPVYVDTPFDVLNSIGNFGGGLTNDKIIGSPAGYGSFRVTEESGAGNFSGSLAIGRVTGNARGIINPDGSFVLTDFGGNLAKTYTLSDLQLISAAGDYAITGKLTRISDGDVVNVHLAHRIYSKSNPTAAQGRYTMVIPANENLGAGSPGGDSIATVKVSADGVITSALIMADGQKISLKSRLSGDDSWFIYKSWKQGEIGGRTTFRDIPMVSDFDGRIRWVRPAFRRAKRFHEGFAMQSHAIGSRYVKPATGERMVPQLASGELDIFGATPAIGRRPLVWSDTNRIAVTGNADERISISASTTNGAITGSYKGKVYENGRGRNRTVPLRGVVFQKQGIAAGHWEMDSDSGYIGITLVP